MQAEIHDAVAAARAADEEAALRRTATYLGAHLFNALYQLDVERLNEEIEQVRAWLPVESFLVVDEERPRPHRRHARQRALRRHLRRGPAPGEAAAPLLVRDEGEETEIRFASPRAASRPAGAS